MAWDERDAEALRARLDAERKRAVRRALDELRHALDLERPGQQLVLTAVALHDPRQLSLRFF